MIDHISIGNQIVYLRKQKKLTQEELAEKLGITAQAISKWENGHTLPETALLPLLAQLFDCTIDSILMPLAVQDAEFRKFANAVGGECGELAVQLYQHLKSKLDFKVSYSEKYVVWDKVNNGGSATFNVADRNDFVIRMDVKAGKDGEGNTLNVRVSLPNCSKYIHVIDDMPEYIKKKFRCNDCKCCSGSCSHTMVYTFEGIDYKQCHFITIVLDSTENMEHILTLVYAEYGKLA